MFDPLAGLDKSLLDAVRFLEAMLYGFITKPEDLLGQSELAQTLLAYVWPLAGLIAVTTLVTLLVGAVLVIRRAVDQVPRLLVPLLLLNIGFIAFWMFIQSWQIGVTRPIAEGILSFGTDLPPQQTLFPDIGTGGDKIAAHAAWILILLIPVVMAICIVGGQIIAPAMFTFATGLYAFGQMARRFFMWSLIFMVVTYTLGAPLIAIVYRLIQWSNSAIPDMGWRTLGQLAAAIFVAIVLRKLFTLVQDRTVEVAKETKSKVRGKVDSRSKRGSKLDANVTRPVKVRQTKAAPASQQSRSNSTATQTRKTGQGRQPPRKSGAVQFGSLVLGSKPSTTKPYSSSRQASQRPPQGKTRVARPDPNRRQARASPKPSSNKPHRQPPTTSFARPINPVKPRGRSTHRPWRGGRK